MHEVLVGRSMTGNKPEYGWRIRNLSARSGEKTGYLTFHKMLAKKMILQRKIWN